MKVRDGLVFFPFCSDEIALKKGRCVCRKVCCNIILVVVVIGKIDIHNI